MTYGGSHSPSQQSYTESLREIPGPTISKEELVKSLAGDMKSQNLKLIDNQDFASKLDRFSRLESLINKPGEHEEPEQSNIILANNISNTALPGLLGKSAKALSGRIFFNGKDGVQLGYYLPQQADSCILLVKDSEGNERRAFRLNGMNLKKGDHLVTWDGKDQQGDIVIPELYMFKVMAQDKKGSGYTADTYIYGNIEAVRFKSEGTLLVLSGTEVPLENVIDISTSR